MGSRQGGGGQQRHRGKVGGGCRKGGGSENEKKKKEEGDGATRRRCSEKKKRCGAKGEDEGTRRAAWECGRVQGPHEEHTRSPNDETVDGNGCEEVCREALAKGRVWAEGGEASRRLLVEWSTVPGAIEKVPWNSALMDVVAPGDLEGGSALFYDLAMGKVSAATVAGVVERALAKKTEVSFVVWVNYHWVATHLTRTRWSIYDSARDKRNSAQIAAWAEAIGLPIPCFHAVPQQRLHSDECGIFAFLYMHRLRRGVTIPELPPVPPRLAPKRPSLKCLTRMMRTVDAAAETGWQRLMEHYRESERVVAAGDGVPESFDVGTHLMVEWHWTGESENRRRERAVVVDRYGTKRRTIHVLRFAEPSPLSSSKVLLPPPPAGNVVIVHCCVDTDPRPRLSHPRDLMAEEGILDEDHHRNYEAFRKGPVLTTFGAPDRATPIGLRPLTVGEFMTARIRHLDEARASCPSMVWTAMVTETRRSHIKELLELQAFVSDLPPNHPLDMAIALYAEAARQKRGLAWSSVSRILQSLVGAFAVFPNYATGEHGEFPPVFVGQWPGVRDSMKTAKRLTNTHGTREPAAATAAQVGQAMTALDAADCVFLQMCWLTSQRPGDVVHVRTSHVAMHGEKAVIRFVEGKNHAATEPYSIHCVVPKRWRRQWLELLGRGKRYLFDVPTKSARTSLLRRVRTALRGTRDGGSLELRSLRRGSLQTLAEHGASVAELLKFSRHQDAKTLRRYLNFDGVADAENQGALEHTRVLGAGPQAAPMFFPESWCGLTADGEMQMVGAPPKPTLEIDRTAYPYHIKDVPPVSLDALTAMAREASEIVRTDWEEARLFLESTGVYERVPRGEPKVSSYRSALVRELRSVQQIDFLSRDRVKSYCHVFLVPEDEKRRWRIIKHPEQVNAALADRVDMMGVTKTNATRRAARLAVLDHEGCVEFDFASYFDQFPLSEGVAEYFAFTNGHGTYVPRRMPMGASFAVAVATAATRILVYGVGEGLRVTIAHQIDNVRIAGPEDDCRLAALRFIDRCRQAGVTLNDFNLPTLYGRVNDFMGDVADYGTKTVCCRERQLRRLDVWWAKLKGRNATYRDWFACYGTADYMAEALGISLARRFVVRSFMRDLARVVARSPELWNESMLLQPPWEDLDRFVGEVRLNRPAALVLHPTTTARVFVDASEWGYGVIVMGPDGSRWYLVHEWSEEERTWWVVSRSTVAEPRAIVLAVDAARRRHPGATILVVTDHLPFVEAFWRGASFSPGYNAALLQLEGMNVPLILRHVAGVAMPADGISRGLSHEPTDTDWTTAARWVESALDSTTRYYRVCGGGIGARTFHSPLFPNNSLVALPREQ